ncbi:unnamed protein product [Coregonus sp. 'balchen']|nr:unnamed protein product [Coregonus sp. 'balchen']
MLDRTEKVKNCQDPEFSKKLLVDYHFEKVQKLKLGVYDVDNKSVNLNDDDFLGGFECTLGQIVSSKKITRPLQLKKGKPAGKGTITITAEEIKDNRAIVLEVEAKGLDKKDLFGKSDPFLEFFKQGDDGKWQLVHRTEVVKNNLSPSWKKFTVALQTFCNCDMSKPIKVTCYDKDEDTSSDMIGEFTCTTRQLLDAKDRAVHCSDYDSDGSHDLIGVFQTNVSELQKASHGSPVGIDFTGSNGDPRSPQSLHYLSPDGLNQYLSATWSVGLVVQDYDTDKLFPAFGFGAQVPPDFKGIVEAYRMALPQVKLYGPTNFSPIINHVASIASGAAQQNNASGMWRPTDGPTSGVKLYGLHQLLPIINHVASIASGAAQQNNASQYFVLLIITDGEITDLDQTRDAIVKASRLPMSIIIIGVGEADFKAMELLDGDDGVLKSLSGEPVARDIVQFVPLRQFANAPKEALAQSVLAEVPNQLVSYFKMLKLDPVNVPALKA